MANHIIENNYVRRETGILTLSTYMELRRARWLKKIANIHSEKIPRKLFGPWLPYARRNSTAGRSKQTIRHAYEKTLHTLGFENTNFESWMKEARDRKIWSKRVEQFLNFPEDSYCRSNSYSLKSFVELQIST